MSWRDEVDMMLIKSLLENGNRLKLFYFILGWTSLFQDVRPLCALVGLQEDAITRFTKTSGVRFRYRKHAFK